MNRPNGALLHDAAEAYLLDLPTPIKSRLPEYIAAERRIQELIERKYNCIINHPVVKAADKEMLEHEWFCYVQDTTIRPIESDIVYNEFMRLFKHYTHLL